METSEPRYKNRAPSRGGPRTGAGRPKGSSNLISAGQLLSTVLSQTGRPYEEILVEDFVAARLSGDDTLVYKYHTLITGRVMNSLARVEVEDTGAAVDATQAAFQAALAHLTGQEPEPDAK